jgi:hypothetical protein
MISIHHHLGLGDHIICNGLVREIYKNDPFVKLYCKKQNAESVSFMYRDLTFLKIIEIDCDEDVIEEKNLLRIGFDRILFYINSEKITWDESFYRQISIDFSKRWSSFYVERDPIRENSLFKKLNPEKEKFALIHSKGSDAIDRINRKLIDKDLKQIEIKKIYTNNIFDYCLLIEKAEEIHCIDSAFKHLIDSFILSNNLFYHNNSNKRSELGHVSKNKWNIV